MSASNEFVFLILVSRFCDPFSLTKPQVGYKAFPSARTSIPHKKSNHKQPNGIFLDSISVLDPMRKENKSSLLYMESFRSALKYDRSRKDIEHLIFCFMDVAG
jgi:hypothetical protein